MADQTARAGHPRRRVIALPLTSAPDGYEHLIAEDAMTAGKTGCFATLCGQTVWAAALACPPGPGCRACIAVRDTDAADGLRHRRTKQRKRWTPAAWMRRHSRARHHR